MDFKIKRASAGSYKNVISQKQFYGILPQTLALGHPTPAGFDALNYFMHSADLWKWLDPAFGKCDCMAPGKYHRARIFAFETPDLYLWTHSETGDRGSGWFFAEKNSPAVAAQGFYQYYTFEKNPAFAKQLIEAFGQIAARCEIARPGTEMQLGLSPFVADHMARIRAHEESSELDASIPLASTTFKIRKL
jgi:hypothetical protein